MRGTRFGQTDTMRGAAWPCIDCVVRSTFIGIKDTKLRYLHNLCVFIIGLFLVGVVIV
jgi:hypothetical protein